MTNNPTKPVFDPRSPSMAAYGQPSFKVQIHRLPVNQVGLLREMACCLCLEMPVPPVRMCARGHFCCRDCATMIPRCSNQPPNAGYREGLCRGKLMKVDLPLYRGIYMKSSFFCKYKGKGCPETPLGENYDKHLAKCPFKDLPEQPTPDQSGHEPKKSASASASASTSSTSATH